MSWDDLQKHLYPGSHQQAYVPIICGEPLAKDSGVQEHCNCEDSSHPGNLAALESDLGGHMLDFM